MGEVWKLNSSPHDSRTLLSCFSTFKGTQLTTQTAILNIPESLDEQQNVSDFLQFDNIEILPTEVRRSFLSIENFMFPHSSRNTELKFALQSSIQPTVESSQQLSTGRLFSPIELSLKHELLPRSVQRTPQNFLRENGRNTTKATILLPFKIAMFVRSI